MMRVLTVDIGASSGRVMAVTLENEHIEYEELYRFITPLINENDHLYWDIKTLLDEIVKGIKVGLNKYDNIKSIGIDTWGVDYGFINKSKELIANPFCYRDMRSEKASKELLEKIPYNDIYKETGIQFLRFNTIFQLYDDFNNRNVNKDVTMLLIPDLIAFFLTGEMRLELTNLSTTSLYNPTSKQISKTLCESANIPTNIFPPIIKPGEMYGYLKEEYLENYKGRLIPVTAVPSHDTASAVLGTNGFGDFLYISSGTWSLLGTEEKVPIMNELSLKNNFTNEIGYNHTVRFLKNIMGMFILNQMRDEWKNKGFEVPLDQIVKVALSTPDVESYIDPDAKDFELPSNMLQKTRNYLEKTNQSMPPFIGQVIKMVYQSMACKYNYVIKSLEETTGRTFKSIIIVGGGNRAELLNQYVANVTNLEVITGPVESTVLGNAVSQFIALGVVDDVTHARQIINQSIITKTYHPEDTKLWEEKYKNFLKATNLGGSYEKGN